MAAAEVRVYVDPADNLADSIEPIPTLTISNDSKSAIEIEVFGGVPSTILESRDADGTFTRSTAATCGNGFEPMHLVPGKIEIFKLWNLASYGPGVSGTYRVVLPYVVRGKPHEAASDPFSLAYGDIAPPDPAATPGHVVLVSATRDHNSPVSVPSPAALATKLLPEIAACVTAAQQRLPWLRGRFTLIVYQYTNPAPTLFVDSSMLGDPAVNKCLGAIHAHDRIPDKFALHFAVSPPTP